MRRAARILALLGLCLGLAGTTLAAKGGPVADPAAAVVAAARGHLGQPYSWGAAGPDSFDCSGLVFAVWGQVGGVRDVPRVSRDQQAWAVPLPVEQVLPGDLVFFGAPVTHVGIVTARSGTAVRMVDAARSQKGVVERPVWTTGVIRYGRVPRAGMPAVQPWTPVAPPPLTLPVASQTRPSTKVAQAAVALARAEVGQANPGDAVFVQRVWSQAGGAGLPATREAIAARGTPVQLADARVGDLVFYGPPTAHVGIYVGGGLMVDASRSLGKVVLRGVWASPTLHLVRLPG